MSTVRRAQSRLSLDRSVAGMMAATVVGYGLLAGEELTSHKAGMVTSLASYQSIVAALLVSTTVAKEFETGTIQWGLTQRLSRGAWLWWRTWPMLVFVALAGAGLGGVMAYVARHTPADMVAYLDRAQLVNGRWPLAVADIVLAAAIGILVGVTTRRVVPAAAISAAVVIALSYAASTGRGSLAPGLSVASAAWCIGAGEVLAAALVLALTARGLRRRDI